MHIYVYIYIYNIYNRIFCIILMNPLCYIILQHNKCTMKRNESSHVVWSFDPAKLRSQPNWYSQHVTWQNLNWGAVSLRFFLVFFEDAHGLSGGVFSVKLMDLVDLWSSNCRSLRHRQQSKKSQHPMPPGWRGKLRRLVLSVKLGEFHVLGFKHNMFVCLW